MRKPTRTRRLSIAAVISLLLFLVVASADIRSYWKIDAWQSVRNGKGHAIGLINGCVLFAGGTGIPFLPNGHTRLDNEPHRSDIFRSLWHFELNNGVDPYGPPFGFAEPLWPLLLLLLIAPARWLIARPANAPGFPVVTDASRL